MLLTSMLATISFGLVASLVFDLLLRFAYRRFASRSQTVLLQFKSGRKVPLELDGRLSTETVSDLVEAAITSATAGDEPGLQRAVEASRAASRRARAEAEAVG